ncbi:ATP-binding protein [Streptomyces sp. ACA25]|uniref:ATP-binding protein n=1 Tax=Streptomyces sp. ACA25 TaxID=3022596 RepID=UPI002307EF16|nr:ATP-binding protein [Streptomyces sp. ACA25]MDB1087643.1 ATP-binding protein [Streptomyces sp. ACA25]
MDPKHPASHGEEPAGPGSGPERTAQIVAGDFLLTVNPVDGSEIEPCPPGRRPISPRRVRDAEGGDEHSATQPPLLEREEECERITRLLSRGRSVRVTGSPGTGRTALLGAAARACAEIAPDGVIRLSGHRRTPGELQYELYAAVHNAPGYRPGGTELLGVLREIGAVVVLDDIEFGGAALDELLDSTPECAFLLSAAPETPAPASDARLEEIPLTGLSRTACLELLEHHAQRPLTEAEADWAADLWFETEGLPLRFVQAAAVLRHRDDPGVPTLAEGTAPARALAASLSDSSREALRLSAAIGGELPAAEVLAAVTGHPAASDAPADLLDRGLITAVGTRHRLAAGVAGQLAEADPGDGATDTDWALSTAQHYTRWLGEAGAAGPARAADEAEVLLAVVAAAQRGGHEEAVVDLARTATPLLAAGLRWGAWERLLRSGQECARSAGAVAQQAYFHHELGVLAICQEQLDRSRAELEASIALRGVLADSGGAHTGRRALALVDDLTRPQAPPPGSEDHTRPTPVATAAAPPPPAPYEDAPLPEPAGAAAEAPTEILTARRDLFDTNVSKSPGLRGMALAGTRRNAVAAGAGAVLLAVLGTVVTLGLAGSDGEKTSDDRITIPTPTESDSGLGETAEPSDSSTKAPTESTTPSETEEETAPETESVPPTTSESTTPSEAPPATDQNPPEADRTSTRPSVPESSGGSSQTGGNTAATGSTSNGGTGDQEGTDGNTGGAAEGNDDGTSDGAAGGASDGTSDGTGGEDDGASEGTNSTGETNAAGSSASGTPSPEPDETVTSSPSVSGSPTASSSPPVV